jgi:hypothetical protein
MTTLAPNKGSVGVESPTLAASHTPDFASICATAFASLGPATSASTTINPPTSTWVTLAPMIGTTCVTVQVPLAVLVDFLNTVGERTAAAGYADVQLWLQKRRRKRAQDPTEFHGMIVDVDVAVADLIALHSTSGGPMPNLVWPTTAGHRAAFVFNKGVDRATFERIGTELTLGISGGDPHSFSPTQGQRLPTCIKTTRAGAVLMAHQAILTNPVPFDVERWRPSLPRRLGRMLAGATELTGGERAVVEVYLENLGMPAPSEPGSLRYACCPAEPDHSKACCYANRADDGRIYVVCLGGHGGEGKRRWSEVTLFGLATGHELVEGTFDPVVDIPPTWAGVELVRDASFGNSVEATTCESTAGP